MMAVNLSTARGGASSRVLFWIGLCGAISLCGLVSAAQTRVRPERGVFVIPPASASSMLSRSVKVLGPNDLLEARPTPVRPDLQFLSNQVSLRVSKPAYWRYEFVEFSVDGPVAGLDPSKHPVLELRVTRHGIEFKGMPGRERALLTWDPDREQWRGTWPVPWNPPLGEMQGELLRPDMSAPERRLWSGPGLWLTVRHDEQGPPLATVLFRLRGKRPADLPLGFSVVTLEPGGVNYNKFPGVDGEAPSWQRLLDWTRFMHADAFFHGGLQTQVYANTKPEDFPWEGIHSRMIDLISGEAQAQGIPYGAYLITFLVGGEFQRAGYNFTLAYDLGSDRVVPIRFVSMSDARRQRHVVEALRRLDSIEGVRYIGMDYVRCDVGGLEFVDQFLSDLGIEIPADLRASSVDERRRWLGRIIALRLDRSVDQLWNWWRAHRVSLVLRDILQEADVHKPVWVFSLGWQQGHQHGQDPRMLIDAGINFNAPMFYEADPEQYSAMLKDWQSYLKDTGGSLVFGQPVDSVLLRDRRGNNGPQEHVQRQADTLEALGPHTSRLGFFWHDIHRATVGGRGPESLREWAIAGATSFSLLREHVGVLPISLRVGEPIVDGLATHVTVTVRNISAAPIARAKVEWVWTSGVDDMEPRLSVIKNLLPGESRDLTYTATLGARAIRARYKAEAIDQRQLAFRARSLEPPSPRPAFGFAYAGQSVPVGRLWPPWVGRAPLVSDETIDSEGTTVSAGAKP